MLDYVKSKTREEEWTPETIAICLPFDFLEIEKMRVGHETIYREIYTRHDLRYLEEYLPKTRPKRRKHR